MGCILWLTFSSMKAVPNVYNGAPPAPIINWATKKTYLNFCKAKPGCWPVSPDNLSESEQLALNDGDDSEQVLMTCSLAVA